MKTLDRYILKQLIFVTFLGVLSLTLLMLLGQLFKELHSLLVESGAPVSIVIDFILQVIPFSLTFTVPWGFLTAVLLVYGRLAADNELTSMRMAGLSLWRLSVPAISMGIVLSAVCYYINIDVAPRGKNAMTELVVNAALENPRNLLNNSQGQTKFDGAKLLINGKKDGKLMGVSVYPIPNNKDEANVMGMGGCIAAHAESAEIGDYNPQTHVLNLTFYNITFEYNEDKEGNVVYMPFINEFPMKLQIPAPKRKMKSNRYTNSEIADLLTHWDFVRNTNPEAMAQYSKAAAQVSPFPCASNLWSAAAEDSKDLHRGMTKKNEREFRTEGVKRASFSLACLVFSLIGVPLAITARRRDTSTGFAIGIMVAALYFVALVFCETSRKSGGITPYILLWLPNVLGIAFAVWQHAKAKYRG